MNTLIISAHYQSLPPQSLLQSLLQSHEQSEAAQSNEQSAEQSKLQSLLVVAQSADAVPSTQSQLPPLLPDP